MSGLADMVKSILSKPKTPTVLKPEPPKEVDQEEEKKKIKRKKQSPSTVLTTPLGLTGEASVRKPTLLGG